MCSAMYSETSSSLDYYPVSPTFITTMAGDEWSYPSYVYVQYYTPRASPTCNVPDCDNNVYGSMSRQPFGSSTVAIDNKIEQAMDLVKSHLMYAVREEIEELKEQIKQLIEKNNQLEYENNILKSAASQETLSKLSQPRPQPPPSSSS